MHIILRNDQSIPAVCEGDVSRQEDHRNFPATSFSRTKDLADEFAEQLSIADEVILLDIYPARELPMEGVTSALIYDKLRSKSKLNIKKDQLLDTLKDKKLEVLVTIGAGDIDKLIQPIKELLTQNP
jgi:UDP-N-acetylmuramate--alanine ligase